MGVGPLQISEMAPGGATSRWHSHAAVADQVGAGGAATLKQLVTEAVNERLRPIRLTRADLIKSQDYLRKVLTVGTGRARETAEATLADIRRLMHNVY